MSSLHIGKRIRRVHPDNWLYGATCTVLGLASITAWAVVPLIFGGWH